MSNTASNYDLPRLVLGICLGALALSTGFAALSLSVVDKKGTRWYTFIVSGMYGMLMFASSYVEEEHQFWYWISSGWLFWLIIRR